MNRVAIGPHHFVAAITLGLALVHCGSPDFGSGNPGSQSKTPGTGGSGSVGANEGIGAQGAGGNAQGGGAASAQGGAGNAQDGGTDGGTNGGTDGSTTPSGGNRQGGAGGLGVPGGGGNRQGSAGNGGVGVPGSGGNRQGGAGNGGLSVPGSGGNRQGGAGNGTGGGATTPNTAAALATKLGKPSRLLLGLGGGAETDEIEKQSIKLDVYERYLVGVGRDAEAWPYWNSPDGAYVDRIVASAADRLGAVPMFTLYQMATAGDGNITGVIDDTELMTAYWAQTKLMFNRIAAYGKPALVNLEPDFWGYAMGQSAEQSGDERPDPTGLHVLVSLNTDCAEMPNDVTGFGKCLLKLARQVAPNAYVGFPPSDWGYGTSTVLDFMKQCGADHADFVVMQTLDGDAGCFEAKANEKCRRKGSGWYWDETNTTSPNFHEHFATAKQYHDELGLPLIWWQTPLGVRSDTAGGTTNHFRDNRVHYFLTHTSELVEAGGLAAVFSSGDSAETNIATDSGQFKTLSTGYLASPAPLQ